MTFADDAAAQAAFEANKSKDPLNDVAPTLLRADHIKEYAEKAGLIFPFDKTRLKTASYGLPLEGLCVWWDEKNKKHEVVVTADDAAVKGLWSGVRRVRDIEIPSNSIVFVTLGPMIRLPDYIAARFNLRIVNVYRGFLAGTGPLVDPGFADRLTFPIHNLTDAAYTLSAGGDTAVWIEFTKISRRNADDTALPAPYSDNEHRYRSRGLGQLLNDANQGRPIRSSIPDTVEQARKALKLWYGVTISGAAVFALALATAMWQVLGFMAQNNSLTTTVVQTQEARIDQQQATIKEQQQRIEQLRRDLAALRRRVK
jgi:deoxycytidine triphosphate deaminase